MKISGIKQQAKRKDRFSVYIDGAYAFSVSDTLLLDSKLVPGMELTGQEVDNYKRLSAEDKLYNNALHYAAMRLRSRWEIESYLQRKQAGPELITQLIDRLAAVGFVDDRRFAERWVENRHLLKPTSRRKLHQELLGKRISADVIDDVLSADPNDELADLRLIIAKKRRQPKFADDAKLMQYLARQGFGYQDIKAVLDNPQD